MMIYISANGMRLPMTNARVKSSNMKNLQIRTSTA